MKLTKGFMDWYQGNNDVGKEPPRSGIRRVGYIIWNYAGKLFVVNLLFLLCCVPAVTIPAAVGALNRYLGKIYLEGYGFSLRDFLDEFKGGLLKNLPVGLLTGILGCYGYYLMSLAGNYNGTQLKGILTGCGFGALLAAVLLGAYAFVLLSMLDLPNKYILRNALLLIFLEWKTSVLVAAETFLFVVVLLVMAPYSILFLLVGFLAVQQLMIYSMIAPVVKKRVTEPYEKMMQ